MKEIFFKKGCKNAQKCYFSVAVHFTETEGVTVKKAQGSCLRVYQRGKKIFKLCCSDVQVRFLMMDTRWSTGKGNKARKTLKWQLTVIHQSYFTDPKASAASLPHGVDSPSYKPPFVALPILKCCPFGISGYWNALPGQAALALNKQHHKNWRRKKKQT